MPAVTPVAVMATMAIVVVVGLIAALSLAPVHILTLLALQNPDLTVADAANIMGNRSPYRPGNRNIRFSGPDQSNG